jgi:DNA invertase Pin-like site-specific DNA recombinase
MVFISDLLQKKVKIHFTKSKFKIDNSISSQAMIFAFSLASQLERELISIRTKDSLAKKKNEGDILGRPKK